VPGNHIENIFKMSSKYQQQIEYKLANLDVKTKTRGNTLIVQEHRKIFLARVSGQQLTQKEEKRCEKIR